MAGFFPAFFVFLETSREYQGYHHAETGRMQLVDEDIHRDFKHTGGDSVWGKH